VQEKADLAIVSYGSFQKEINFNQVHKSMEYGSMALRHGGVMNLLEQL
jgi:hydrogenase maturation factor